MSITIIISQWALDAYLNLKHSNVINRGTYKNIRADALLLASYPSHPKFGLQQFWCIAKSPSGIKIPSGFKMKWDQVGPGKVELRLPVVIRSDAVLCQAYVKSNSKSETRYLAKFRAQAELVLLEKYTKRGVLK